MQRNELNTFVVTMAEDKKTQHDLELIQEGSGKKKSYERKNFTLFRSSDFFDLFFKEDKP